MLLFDLIEYYISTPCLPEFIVDYCPWNSCKEKHVEEYERYEKYVICLEILYCQQLEIRVEIPRSHPVYEIYHPSHLIVVVVVLICRVRHIGPPWVRVNKITIKSDSPRANKGKTNDDDGVVKNKGECLSVG